MLYLFFLTIIKVEVDYMSIDYLGSRIKQERQAKGLTQEQLAERADISLNFMSLIENGKNMSVQTLVAISNALGVSVDYLLGDIIDLQNDQIMRQIVRSLEPLSDAEKLYFLNTINQYKTLKK